MKRPARRDVSRSTASRRSATGSSRGRRRARPRAALRRPLRVPSLRDLGAGRVPERAAGRRSTSSTSPTSTTRCSSWPAASRCSRRPGGGHARSRRASHRSLRPAQGPSRRRARTCSATSSFSRCGACSPRISDSSPSHLFTRDRRRPDRETRAGRAPTTSAGSSRASTTRAAARHGLYAGTSVRERRALRASPARVHLTPEELSCSASAGEFDWRKVEPTSSARCSRAGSATTSSGRSAPTTPMRRTSRRSSSRRSSSRGASGSRTLSTHRRGRAARRPTCCTTSCSIRPAAPATSSTSPTASCAGSSSGCTSASSSCAAQAASRSRARSRLLPAHEHPRHRDRAFAVAARTGHALDGPQARRR